MTRIEKRKPGQYAAGVNYLRLSVRATCTEPKAGGSWPAVLLALLLAALLAGVVALALPPDTPGGW